MQQYDEDNMWNFEADYAFDNYYQQQDEAEQLEAEAAAPPPASVADAVSKHPDLEVPSRVFERRVENADTGYGRELMMHADDREDWDRLDDHSKQMSVGYANRMWTKGNMDGRWQGKDGETEEKQFVRRVINSDKRKKAATVEPMEDDLELSSSSEEDEYVRKKLRPMTDAESRAYALIHQDESSESSSSEDESPRRSTRARATNPYEKMLGSALSLQSQQQQANGDKSRLSHLVEVRDSRWGRGLFASQDLNPGDLILNYYGAVYSSEENLPEDVDTSYMMENDGMRFDGQGIEQLGKYPNHSGVNPNMEFSSTEGQPLAELHVIKAIRKDEEIMIDYGAQYNYSHMGSGYTRHTS